MNISSEFDKSRRNSPWGLTSRRHDLLGGLLDDLVDLESTGLPEADCESVKKSLQKMCNALSAIPDHSVFRGTILGAMSEFAKAYTYWNDEWQKPGKTVHAISLRRKGIRWMQRCRNVLATRERNNVHILRKELDLKLIDDVYAAVGDLAKNLPDKFKGVCRAIQAFSKNT